ncbi:two-component system response regulator NarL [Methylococcaceae bacterium HT1]|nr:two-component system response regulator NarL [Methylococcaceae bacterium CS5]TXL01916.1 two-component system response regulator NarL [Methylococcaceae bacterium HT1]TXL04741.1 two-component system response regulator NarL [Methylococcaceae bacterium CS2]TXL08937.1 two-component system response regulator NarL [Methylococcaceae bacterium CS1]TXL15781.1 two-component system response regulator NarL [Methylococcaceae bacterium HT5]TXL16121.1 two-component system response regulator NarL [Methyloco
MTEKPYASVIIIDDHPLLRKGLGQLLEFEPELKLLAEASNGEQGLALAMQNEPDLIILDLNMPGMSGIDTLIALRDAGITSRILMLTVSDNVNDISQAIQAGADGYLLKDMEPELLLEEIKKAAIGQMVIDARLTKQLVDALPVRQADPESKLADLTSRELEVATLLAEGQSNKQIAKELEISQETVKVHVKHVLNKLKLNSRVKVALYMVQQK